MQTDLWTPFRRSQNPAVIRIIVGNSRRSPDPRGRQCGDAISLKELLVQRRRGLSPRVPNSLSADGGSAFCGRKNLLLLRKVSRERVTGIGRLCVCPAKINSYHSQIAKCPALTHGQPPSRVRGSWHPVLATWAAGAADCGEYCQAAGVGAEALNGPAYCADERT